MDLVGKAKRVRVYVKESDVIGRKLAPQAILEFLQAESVAGATALRGTAGFGSSGRIDDDSMPELAPHLPVIVEWVDGAERVQRLLPRLKEMVGRGLITVEEVEIAHYRPHGLHDLPATVTAGEVMSRDVRSVPPDAPLRSVVELLDGKIYRAVPVVQDGRAVGIITNQDLTGRGGLLARVELLAALPAGERASPLAEVLEAIVATPMQRALVIDAQQRVVGIVGDEELLDRVTPALRPGVLASLVRKLPFTGKAGVPAQHSRAQCAADLMSQVATAREDQLLRDAIAPMMKAPHKLVAVVDAEGEFVGAVDRVDILRGLVS